MSRCTAYKPCGAILGRCSSGVEQRIRNAWVGGSIPFNGTSLSAILDYSLEVTKMVWGSHLFLPKLLALLLRLYAP